LARSTATEVAVGPPGIAYVIGPAGIERDAVERTLRELTAMPVAVAIPNRAALAALASRNVKLIAVDSACLVGLWFRNELALRHRQPRLNGARIVVYGQPFGAEEAGSFDRDLRPFNPGDLLPART